MKTYIDGARDGHVEQPALCLRYRRLVVLGKPLLRLPGTDPRPLCPFLLDEWS